MSNESNLSWDQILSDPCAPFWARDLVRVIRAKDPVDVVHTLEHLTAIARAETNEVALQYSREVWS